MTVLETRVSVDGMRALKRGGGTVFLCETCGFGYNDPETAVRCESFCEKHNSCSVEITRKAVYRPET